MIGFWCRGPASNQWVQAAIGSSAEAYRLESVATPWALLRLIPNLTDEARGCKRYKAQARGAGGSTFHD